MGCRCQERLPREYRAGINQKQREFKEVRLFLDHDYVVSSCAFLSVKLSRQYEYDKSEFGKTKMEVVAVEVEEEFHLG